MTINHSNVNQVCYLQVGVTFRERLCRVVRRKMLKFERGG